MLQLGQENSRIQAIHYDVMQFRLLIIIKRVYPFKQNSNYQYTRTVTHDLSLSCLWPLQGNINLIKILSYKLVRYQIKIHLTLGKEYLRQKQLHNHLIKKFSIKCVRICLFSLFAVHLKYNLTVEIDKDHENHLEQTIELYLFPQKSSQAIKNQQLLLGGLFIFNRNKEQNKKENF